MHGTIYSTFGKETKELAYNSTIYHAFNNNHIYIACNRQEGSDDYFSETFLNKCEHTCPHGPPYIFTTTQNYVSMSYHMSTPGAILI